MNVSQGKNIKLGTFVITGLFFLILMLYLIGKNKNLFGSSFQLKATFENVNGLEAGNNIRYAGINVGTVDRLDFINDTIIEVTMLMNKKVKHIIRKNAIASIGTDGLVGNKIINIVATEGNALAAEPGDFLKSRKSIDTDDMLRTLSKTNENIKTITDSLIYTVTEINKSQVLKSILNDTQVSRNLKQTIINAKNATSNFNTSALLLKNMLHDVNEGKGNLGLLIRDTTAMHSIHTAVANIDSAGRKISHLSQTVNMLAENINNQAENGNGTLGMIMRDSLFSNEIRCTVQNFKKAAKDFDENMKALQHNIFFRNYFKKKEQEKATLKINEAHEP